MSWPREKQEQKMVLTWAPCPSLCLHAAQPRESCSSPHQHRRAEETDREGRRERHGESVSVCGVCAHEREMEGVGRQSEISALQRVCSSSFFCPLFSRFPKQVMLVQLARLHLPSGLSECCTASQGGGLGTATSLHIPQSLSLVSAAL